MDFVTLYKTTSTTKTIFTFCKKQHNKIKLLVWEDNGIRIYSLEKLNTCYIEQLKLRHQKKFSASCERMGKHQISLDDDFYDAFNEAEVLC